MTRLLSLIPARASLALAAAFFTFTLATPSLALAGGPACSGGPGGHGDPELKSAHLQLMAAKVVAKLGLSSEQKKALTKILGEARKVRDERRSDPAIAKHRTKVKALLAKATVEVRKNGGELSAETRAGLEALRAERAPERKEMHATMRELMKSARGVLTPEQHQLMKNFKGPKGEGPGAMHGGPEGMRGKRGDPGAMHGGPEGMRGKHGKRGKKMMHLLLSDEFLAELAR